MSLYYGVVEAEGVEGVYSSDGDSAGRCHTVYFGFGMRAGGEKQFGGSARCQFGDTCGILGIYPHLDTGLHGGADISEYESNAA